MKSKMNVHGYFLILLMVIVLILGVYLLTYKNIETALMPGAVCAITFLLAAVQLRNELIGKKKKALPEKGEQKHEKVDGADSSKSELRSYLIGFAWLIGLFASCFLIGFLISTPLFVFVYMKTHGRTWLSSIITGVVMAAIVFTLVELLQMYLFPGILFGG